eukprot:m.404490 g.404490  ORF g.404490 m.404490 type:complete len:224 (+) comp56476_c0_seq6:676-1347(+)
MAYATYGAANTRDVQLFINIVDNPRLDSNDVPLGKVISGMEVIDSLFMEYREQPDQWLIRTQGNQYLKENFPSLDYILSARILSQELTAPASFRVLFKTTKGEFLFEAYRDWAPIGVDRLYLLIISRFYNEGIAVYRAVPDFLYQFGIHGDPAISRHWASNYIEDDPLSGHSNTRGTVSFATLGPLSLSVYLNLSIYQSINLSLFFLSIFYRSIFVDLDLSFL